MVSVAKSALVGLLRLAAASDVQIRNIQHAFEHAEVSDFASEPIPAKSLLRTYTIKLSAARNAGADPVGVEALLQRLARMGNEPVLIFGLSNERNDYGIFTNKDVTELIGYYQIELHNTAHH